MPRQIHIPLGGLRPWPGGAWHVGYAVYQRVVAVGVEDGSVVDTDRFDGEAHDCPWDHVVVAWGVGPLYLLRGWSGPVVALACWQEVVSRAGPGSCLMVACSRVRSHRTVRAGARVVPGR